MNKLMTVFSVALLSVTIPTLANADSKEDEKVKKEDKVEEVSKEKDNKEMEVEINEEETKEEVEEETKEKVSETDVESKESTEESTNSEPITEETTDNQASFNPTEPEIQLGDIKNVDIKESGAVILDSKSSQGIITGEKLVEIDGVRGKGQITYILDKDSQDIISVHSNDMVIVGEDGSTVQINEVEELSGNNGVADGDGFKSNLVTDDIPKTGLPPQFVSPLALGTVGSVFVLLFFMNTYFRKENAN